MDLTPGSTRAYWRLSAYYFAHFAVAGALFPYLGIYLLSRDFKPSAVGELFAALTVTKLVAPFCWAWLADRFHAHLMVVRATSLAATVCFIGFALEPEFRLIFAVFASYSFFWNATLPQFEALTLSHLGSDATRYARIRLWGSVGYILSVAGLGAYFEVGSVGWLPLISLALMACVCLVTWLVPDAAPFVAATSTAASVRTPLMRPTVLAFLSCCLLMQMSHGAYYTFYTVYLLSHGYASATIGLLWALGVVSEIILFMVVHRLLARFSVRYLVCGCFVLTALRWFLLARYVDLGFVVVLSQILHAISYGAFHAVSILLIAEPRTWALGSGGTGAFTPDSERPLRPCNHRANCTSKARGNVESP